jgi:hypothetical protein
MLPKYTIEYSVPLKRHAPINHYGTDDPVACEEFLSELMDRGFRIQAIRHDGIELPKHEFDRMIKTAAGMIASHRVCASLGIKAEEERFRFGFAA